MEPTVRINKQIGIRSVRKPDRNKFIKTKCLKYTRILICQGIIFGWIGIFIIFIIIFMWAQMMFSNRPLSTDENESIHINPRHIALQKVIKTTTESPTLYEPKKETATSNKSAEDAILKIRSANKAQIVYNKDIYGPLGDDSIVLLVQVHNRIIYLENLIESLSKARHIDEVLLVFSHDVYNEEMNKLIRAITFTKVMQIFFPYSLEAYPDKFPGNDPRDCPRDLDQTIAKEIRCLNAETPDKYGHYRESQFTQIKHHWWWKMNYVFNHLNITSKHTGLVVFLEEDHYVAEDFIHVLKLMDTECKHTNKCHFLGLGLHANILFGIDSNSDKVKMSSSATNLGLAFNRKTFVKILMKCAEEFCHYDDYNWDWSLNYIISFCNKSPVFTMIPLVSRVFHIGECGTHVHKNDCSKQAVPRMVQKIIESIKLYPSSLKLISTQIQKLKFQESGGWGDPRDHKLCLTMTKR